MTDAFPSLVSTTVQRVKHPETKRGFRKIFDSNKLMISTTFLEKDKVYFDPVQDRSENLIANFYRTGSESFIRWDDYDSVSWDAVASRLNRDRSVKKKNTDVRVSFRYDNTFVVKPYFTFGQRVVEPGTCHIYQTTAAPVFFYVLPDKRTFSVKVLRKNRGFRAADQFAYKLYVLEPESKYRVKEGICYVLVTAQKTLFSVDVVAADQPLPFHCRDWRETTKWKRKRDIYEKAPQTPALDRLDEYLMPPPPAPLPYHAPPLPYHAPPVDQAPPVDPAPPVDQAPTDPEPYQAPPLMDSESQTDPLPLADQTVLYVMPDFANMYNHLLNRELGPPIPRNYVQTCEGVPEPMDLSSSRMDFADIDAWLMEPQTPNVVNLSENLDDFFKNLEQYVMSV